MNAAQPIADPALARQAVAPQAIIGRGAYGTALHQVMQSAGVPTRLLGREAWGQGRGQGSGQGREEGQEQGREQGQGSGQDDQLEGVSTVFLAVPTKSLRQVLGRLAVQSDQDWDLVLCCKGIEPQTGLLPSQIVTSVLPQAEPFVLSGPGFATDLAAGRPVAHTLAHGSRAAAMAAGLSTATFRLYHCDDVVGTQLCGALKNIVAIAAGIASGLGHGESARAALITRATVEMRLLVERLGGQPDTLWTLAGIGDLMLTCGSSTSRNFRFGEAIGRGQDKGRALDQIGTVEGVGALSGLEAKTTLDDAPICQGLIRVLDHGASPGDILSQWMTQRPVARG